MFFWSKPKADKKILERQARFESRSENAKEADAIRRLGEPARFYFEMINREEVLWRTN